MFGAEEKLKSELREIRFLNLFLKFCRTRSIR